MHKKGFLTRESQGRAHLYEASIAEEDLQQTLLGGFLKIAFGGSAKKLVMQALGNHKTTQEETREKDNLFISRSLVRRERECRCDDMAIQTTQLHQKYLKIIAKLESKKLEAEEIFIFEKR